MDLRDELCKAINIFTSEFSVSIIRDKTELNEKLIQFYFEKKNIEYKEIFSVNGSILSKLMNLIYLFDYATIYRSVISGIDPTPVSAIDFIKSRLS